MIEKPRLLCSEHGDSVSVDIRVRLSECRVPPGRATTTHVISENQGTLSPGCGKAYVRNATISDSGRYLARRLHAATCEHMTSRLQSQQRRSAPMRLWSPGKSPPGFLRPRSRLT